MEQVNVRSALRSSVFFGFDWQFTLTDDRTMPGVSADWRSVQLPHDWSTDYEVKQEYPSAGSGGYARTGIGWYRKTFAVDALPTQQISLYFEGVYMNCDLWLNGQKIGNHVYGYTSFEIDITGALLPGENTLLVRVDNARQPNSRWYTGSGITRNVYLVATEALHVATWGTFITVPAVLESEAKIQVETRILGGRIGDAIRLKTEILDANGTLCATAERAVNDLPDVRAAQQLTVASPRLWDLNTPYLYTAVTHVYLNDDECDVYETRFGIRLIAFNADDGFRLNGRKEILKGVCLHHDGGCVGAAVPPEIWRRRLGKLKKMGVNALRCSHNPPDPALLDLADELGFVVMDEIFDEWRAMKGKEFGSNTHQSCGYSEWYETCWREDITTMLLRDRNHPSIIMWSIGNEVREQVDPNGWKVARELAGVCHSYDATRPITQGCDQMKAEPVRAYNSFLDELDIVGVNYTDRWRERTETFFDEEKREHPGWMLMGTEDIAVNGLRGDYRLQTEESVWNRMQYFAKSIKAERLWKYIRTRPYVIGSFMWTGVDYLGECFWPDKGAAAGVLDTCGFEKDGYYFYQSIWHKEEPVLFLCPHLNMPLAQGTIYPLICYTNCFTVELFVDGASYGVKAYEFPAQGMTKEWAHFDHAQAPVTTGDLHLCWDIPYTQGEIVAIGRNREGVMIARKRLVPAGAPTHLEVQTDCAVLPADGRAVAQLEIALLDAEGTLVPDADRDVRIIVRGGELLGLDNGNPACRTIYRTPSRYTLGGLLYGVVRAPRTPGDIQVEVETEGLAPVHVTLKAQ